MSIFLQDRYIETLRKELIRFIRHSSTENEHSTLKHYRDIVKLSNIGECNAELGDGSEMVGCTVQGKLKAGRNCKLVNCMISKDSTLEVGDDCIISNLVLDCSSMRSGDNMSVCNMCLQRTAFTTGSDGCIYCVHIVAATVNIGSYCTLYHAGLNRSFGIEVAPTAVICTTIRAGEHMVVCNRLYEANLQHRYYRSSAYLGPKVLNVEIGNEFFSAPLASIIAFMKAVQESSEQEPTNEHICLHENNLTCPTSWEDFSANQIDEVLSQSGSHSMQLCFTVSKHHTATVRIADCFTDVVANIFLCIADAYIGSNVRLLQSRRLNNECSDNRELVCAEKLYIGDNAVISFCASMRQREKPPLRSGKNEPDIRIAQGCSVAITQVAYFNNSPVKEQFVINKPNTILGDQ